MTCLHGATVASSRDRQRESFAEHSRGNASWFTLFSADITPTDAMCAGIMEIPSNGGTLKAHRHAQSEIYFVVRGSGNVTVEGEILPASPGTAIYIPGGAEHSVSNEEDDVLQIFYVFPAAQFSDVRYQFAPNPSGIQAQP